MRYLTLAAVGALVLSGLIPADAARAPDLGGAILEDSTVPDAVGHTCRGTSRIGIPMVPMTVKKVSISASFEACVGAISDVSLTLEDGSVVKPEDILSPSGSTSGAGAVTYDSGANCNWYIGNVVGELYMQSASGGRTYADHTQMFQWNPCDYQLLGISTSQQGASYYPWNPDGSQNYGWDDKGSRGPELDSSGISNFHSSVWPYDYHTDFTVTGTKKNGGSWLYGAYCEQRGDLPWTRHVECNAYGSYS